ncbi:MAG: hypothetical protein BM563_03475 [Bacteroidetes bacterium MedPE-SWsnd-G1]|nr:MAG: hypothetical protein BM563_03475 [Bacteroidetes bacterium MedPE-SWsnd-G1]
MKKLKSHFWYNKRQRNGIFFLLILIVVVQFFYWFWFPNYIGSKTYEVSHTDQVNIEKFQKELDSLEKESIAVSKPKIFPFNPSFITDFKGYQIGMSTDEIDRLLAFRAKGEYINSTEQFQEVTKISDSLLAEISPYFKFPEWVNKQKTQKKYRPSVTKYEVNHPIVKQDLNVATEEDFIKIYGIGETLSNRIVKFRNSIGGFMNDDQLSEVYGLKPEVVLEVLKKYTVLSKPIIAPLNINAATFKEVLRLPYIDYELTKLIFDYRDEVAEIQDLEELKNIEGFPLELFDRIAVYLEAK